VLGAEGYLDFCLSAFANLEEPYFETGDDIFNMGLTYAILPIIFIFPAIAYFIQAKNQEHLDKEPF
jgi:hypothetical protein